MQTCSYCGRVNDDESDRCGGCALDLPAPSPPKETTVPERARRFFRWKPTVTILLVFGVIFGLGTVLNVWMMIRAGQGSIHNVRFENTRQLIYTLYRGAVGNAGIAILCFVGWHFMRRHTRRSLLGGALAVAAALFITSTRWILWEIAGRTQGGWLEPLLTWPFLAYAVIYGYREGAAKVDSKHDDPNLPTG